MTPRSFRKVWLALEKRCAVRGHRCVVGLAGPECSGKTTLAAILREYADSSGYKVIIVSLDGYLRFSRDERIAFAKHHVEPDASYIKVGDHPICFDFDGLRDDIVRLVSTGYLESVPEYDYIKGQVIRNHSLVQVSDKSITLIEGLFALNEKLVNLYDATIYIDAHTSLLKDRYLKRHLFRGAEDSKAIMAQFDNIVLPAQRRFVEPTRSNAQILVTVNKKIMVSEVV